MPVASPSAVRKQIQLSAPDSVYLLQGEDEVEKSALAAAFGELVEEGLRAFNVERLHAGDMTTGDKIAPTRGDGFARASARRAGGSIRRRLACSRAAQDLISGACARTSIACCCTRSERSASVWKMYERRSGPPVCRTTGRWPTRSR